MTRDVRLTDDQIERMLRRRSSEPYPGLVRDILTSTSDLEQQRRWGLEWPSSRFTVLAAAALLAALLIGGALAAGALRDLWNPVPPPLRSEWTGPLRPDMATMPKIVVAGTAPSEWSWTGDPSDVESAGIDVTGLRYSLSSGRHWRFSLRGAAPYPTSQVVEYGVVLDDKADGIPDCVVGINNGGPPQGEYHIWVTNLVSGETQEQVGPPYGGLVDWFTDLSGPAMTLMLRAEGPCDLSPLKPLAFYAWTSVSVDGEVVTWDYAPDAAWLVAETRP